MALALWSCTVSQNAASESCLIVHLNPQFFRKLLDRLSPSPILQNAAGEPSLRGSLTAVRLPVSGSTTTVWQMAASLDPISVTLCPYLSKPANTPHYCYMTSYLLQPTYTCALTDSSPALAIHRPCCIRVRISMAVAVAIAL